MFSVIEELSSYAFRKIAAPVSPRRWYPELPDLSDNPLLSYIIWRRYKAVNKSIMLC